MKIDPRAESSREVAPSAAEQLRQSAKAVEKPSAKAAEKQPSDAVEKPSPDEVKLSSETRLADEAVRAAAISGDVRPAAVHRARRLLLSGELGRNTEALAERIIDSLIQSRVHPDSH